MKEFYKDIRTPFLTWITYINFTTHILALCALDSDSIIPHIVALITGTFLILRAKAEGWFEQRGHHYGR